MVKLTADELRTLALLAKTPEGSVVTGVLNRMLESADQDCRTLDGPALHRAQGRALAYAGLISTLNDAAANLQPRPLVTRRDWQGPTSA